MKRIIVALCLTCLLVVIHAGEPPSSAQTASVQPPADSAASTQPAADKAPARWSAVRTWFQHFKEGLESTGAEREYQRKNVSVTAVAAVRGSRQKLDNPDKPYVKGRLDAKREAALAKERAELGAIVDLVLAGKMDEGMKKIDAFEAAHPKSSYLPDARKAREKIKELKSETGPTSESAAPVAAPTATPGPAVPAAAAAPGSPAPDSSAPAKP